MRLHIFRLFCLSFFSCGLSASMWHILLIKRTHNKRRVSFWSGISQSTRCNSRWEFVYCCCLRCCFFCCWYRFRRRCCGVATWLWKPSMQNPGPICIYPHLAVLEDVLGRKINMATMVESCRKSTVTRRIEGVVHSPSGAVVFNTIKIEQELQGQLPNWVNDINRQSRKGGGKNGYAKCTCS